MPNASRIDLPVRRPNYRFALTPFADAMFQLLIFFMLSSNLTPYSFLTLQSAPAVGDAPASAMENAPPPSSSETPGEVALWRIEAGNIVVGGQSFEFDALGDLANALGTASAPADVILIVRGSAAVQDVATVLEALEKAHIGSVRISTEPE